MYPYIYSKSSMQVFSISFKRLFFNVLPVLVEESPNLFPQLTESITIHLQPTIP